MRRAELEAAARILGFQYVEPLGHPDGALGGVDQDELIGQIVRHLRRERPQVVVTFGPEGAPNTHRDHQVICRAATAAFFLASRSTAYAGQTAGGLTPHAASRLFYATWPDPEPGAELQVRGAQATARIDVAKFRNVEMAAFHAHASQQMLRARFEELSLTSEEWFALASGVPQPAPVIDDLFAGLSR